MNWCFAQATVPFAAASVDMTGLFCFLFFLVFMFTAVALIVSLIARRRNNPAQVRRAAMKRKIAQIERDFPDEVRAWGGAEALEDPAALRAIIAKLESSPEAGR